MIAKLNDRSLKLGLSGDMVRYPETVRLRRAT